MSHLTIYQDNYTNSTIISNRFIDEYMKAANDAQLKIYLYLIRMMSAGLSTSVSEIADVFNYTEKDVLRALKYWEKNQLLTLEYDENKNLTGLHLRDLAPAVPVPAPIGQTPSSMYVVPISSKTAAPEPEMPAAFHHGTISEENLERIRDQIHSFHFGQARFFGRSDRLSDPILC